MCSFNASLGESSYANKLALLFLIYFVFVFIISTPKNNSTGISSCYSSITRLPNDMVCYRKSPYIHCTDKEYYITGKYIGQHDSAATRGRELQLRGHKRVWDRREAVLGCLIRLSILSLPGGYSREVWVEVCCLGLQTLPVQLRQKLLISLPFLPQEILFYGPDLFYFPFGIKKMEPTIIWHSAMKYITKRHEMLNSEIEYMYNSF